MPAMLRINKKARKIVRNILGKPSNEESAKDKRKRENQG